MSFRELSQPLANVRIMSLETLSPSRAGDFKTCPQLLVEDVLTPSMLPLDFSPGRFRPLPKGPEDLTPWGVGPAPR